eukprot:CAMPEP_0194266946 /NCGR_PEP_ID=MMETSP0169-20130528/1663_1 /TAXON_ID=218684 /ORGANISM="Corethron pennatum, Strain L29A3" /LENGTH=129 /DNA_ID=CAMNT_0039007725 /DNA_START=48 /DNA_END=437 /DNA_ORIENTATION=+
MKDDDIDARNQDPDAPLMYSKLLYKVLKSSISADDTLMDMTDDGIAALCKKLDTLSSQQKAIGTKRKGKSAKSSTIPPVWNVISTSYSDAVERDLCVRLSSDPNFSSGPGIYPNAEAMVERASRNAIVN